MNHGSASPYIVVGAVGLGLALALGINPGFLLIVLVCPLMMVFMMRGMDHGRVQPEDHTGHGCEHDPTRHDDRTER